MQWHEVEKEWTQLKDKAHEQWPRLTEEQLIAVAGDRRRLVLAIEACYGTTRAQVEKQVFAWQSRVKRPRIRAVSAPL